MIGAATDVTQGRKELIDIEKGLHGERIDFTMAQAEFLTLSNNSLTLFTRRSRVFMSPL